jgi:Fe2+-dicitrate sensor, membrane component
MNEQLVGKASHIAHLIIRRMQNKLTDDEWTELESWLQEDGDNFLLYEELMDEQRLGQALDELHAVDHMRAFEQLSQKLMLPPMVSKRTTKRLWWYMVAALLLITAGAILYIIIDTRSPHSKMPRPLVTAQKKPGGATDSQKAILTLSNSTMIVLDKVNNGPIAQQGNSLVHKKKNGELIYTFSKGKKQYEEAYNTIQTPRSATYQLSLEDGTRIWLNAASTLHFPVHFKGNERRVTLTGEAYFEIAPSPTSTGNKKTFMVHAGDMEVQALGTAFNISAYKEDIHTSATVAEGLVKVTSRHSHQLLPPGKKLVAKGDTIQVVEADITQEIAWKNGQFVFRNTSLQDVMNELARWYDVQVAYEQPMPVLHFSGEITRHAHIEQAIEMLALTGGVRFEVEGRQVKVFPVAHSY